MKRIIIAIVGCLLSVCGFSQLRVASVFTDNAVLQQNVAIPVWGDADPWSHVTVSFGEITVTSVADSIGEWKLYLPPFAASFEPRSMCISSNGQQINFNNILVGEVWFASGQSNMDFRVGWKVKDMEREIVGADLPGIRYFPTKQESRPSPQRFTSESGWQVCSPATIANCSAVAYFFAKNLHAEQKVPVGIIISALGATCIESWMSREALATVPGYKQKVAENDIDQRQWDSIVAEVNKANNDRWQIADTTATGERLGIPTLQYDDGKWETMKFPLRVEDMKYFGYWGMVWVRKVFTVPLNFDVMQQWRLHIPIGASGDRIYLNGKQIFKNISYNEDKNIVLEKGLIQPGKNVISANLFITWGVGGIGTDQSECYLLAGNGQKINLTEGVWSHSNRIEPALPPYRDYTNYMGVNFNGMVSPVIPYAIRGFLWYQGEANSLEAGSYAALQAAMINDWRIWWQQGYLPFLYVQLANYRPRSKDPMAHDDWAEFRDAQTAALDLSQHVGMACAIDIGEAEDIHPRNKQEVGRRLYLIAKAKVYQNHLNTEFSGPMVVRAARENDHIRINFSHASGLHHTSGMTECFAIGDAEGRLMWATAHIEEDAVLVKIPPGFKPVMVQYAWGNNPVSPLYNNAGLPTVPFKIKLTKTDANAKQ